MAIFRVEKGLVLHRYWSFKCQSCGLKTRCTRGLSRLANYSAVACASVSTWSSEAVSPLSTSTTTEECSVVRNGSLRESREGFIVSFYPIGNSRCQPSKRVLFIVADEDEQSIQHFH